MLRLHLPIGLILLTLMSLTSSPTNAVDIGECCQNHARSCQSYRDCEATTPGNLRCIASRAACETSVLACRADPGAYGINRNDSPECFATDEPPVGAQDMVPCRMLDGTMSTCTRYCAGLPMDTQEDDPDTGVSCARG